nr:hypothetical protein CFP56_40206 [Quercus suber]
MTSLALAMLMVMASIILISGNHKVSTQCQGSISNLKSKCLTSVQKARPEIPPSADCCAVVMGLDIPCGCNLVTQAVENMIWIKLFMLDEQVDYQSSLEKNVEVSQVTRLV